MLCDYEAGWIAGVVSLLFGHPLETIKIQQQIRGISFREAVSRIMQHRGWPGFYRGMLVPLLTTGALNAVFFGVYGDVRDFLVRTRAEREWKFESNLNDFANRSKDIKNIRIPTPKVIENYATHLHTKRGFYPRPFQADFWKMKQATFAELFISGALAGAVCLALTAPADLIKTKLQSQMKRQYFTGPFDCFVKIIKEGGIRGLFRGIVPMTLREVIACGLYAVIFQTVKDKARANSSLSQAVLIQATGGACAGSGVSIIVLCYFMELCRYTGASTSNLGKALLANGLAGVVSWTFVLPFDTIKTRMQADDHKRPHYRSMRQCATEIYKLEGGISGLYRGFGACLVRTIPVNASIFVVYEAVQRKLC